MVAISMQHLSGPGADIVVHNRQTVLDDEGTQPELGTQQKQNRLINLIGYQIFFMTQTV